MSPLPPKPLNQKSYGSIAHLPGSRQGRDDVGLDPGAARICLEKARDKHDRIIVQQKVDGSNVAVANVDGVLIPLGRAGHPAVSSKYIQHRYFAMWFEAHRELFEFLQPGERLCGEWLAQAHGTRYALTHEPFVPFDIMRVPHVRATFDDVRRRLTEAWGTKFIMPQLLHEGGPCSIERALSLLDPAAHGALDEIEGAVWRIERKGEVDYLAKFVRHDKVDGKFLPELSGGPEVWNWLPPEVGPGQEAADKRG